MWTMWCKIPTPFNIVGLVLRQNYFNLSSSYPHYRCRLTLTFHITSWETAIVSGKNIHNDGQVLFRITYLNHNKATSHKCKLFVFPRYIYKDSTFLIMCCMSREKVSISLDKDERSLRTFNLQHVVKALSLTLWHLTNFFFYQWNVIPMYTTDGNCTNKCRNNNG